MKRTKVYVGMDVHKDSVMIAVLPEGVRKPTLARRLSHDPRGIRRLLDRLSREHEVCACYEASGAGYVLERMIRSWGHACEIVAPSLIPRRPGERRRHDRKDAEYLALLDYKLDRRDELDRQIEALALEPAYREAVGRLCCLKGISTQAAMVLVTEIGDFRALRASGQADGIPGSGAERALERVEPAAGLDHEDGQQPGPTRPGAGGLELSVPASARRRAETTPGGLAPGGRGPQLEGAAPAP